MTVPRMLAFGAIGALALAVHLGLGAAMLVGAPWARGAVNVVLMIVLLIVVLKIAFVVLGRFSLHRRWFR